MIARTAVIINKTGLHARPASEFVQEANKFKSNITICRTQDRTERENVKSIMNLLMLGLHQGDEVEIAAEGADAKEAVDGLIALINSGFGE